MFDMEENPDIDDVNFQLPQYPIYQNEADDSTENNQEPILPNWINQESASFTYDKKPATSVYDVAAYILNKYGSITTMKLHKLLYYCQAWALVWDEKPLFEEVIEAWANGPVVSQLFAYHRGMYTISSLPIGNKDSLDESQRATINAVLDFYGAKSAQWLIDLTHMEDPWRNARKGLATIERGSKLITLDSMAAYYSSLRLDELNGE